MIAFRKLEAGDIEFLKEMFYQSLYFHTKEEVLPKSVIEKPELAKYYENWGGKDDHGIVVTSNQEAIGAIWSRMLTKEQKSWGYVDDETPELGIALKEAFRDQGLGTQLIQKLIEELQQAGFAQVSLSVDKRNRVVGLYKRIGFKILNIDGNSWTMVYNLRT